MTADKFHALEAAVAGDLIERDVEAHLVVLAAVSGVPFFMVGDGGVAKTLLAERTAGYVADAELFVDSIDQWTTPEDLFGPRSVKAMKADRWERVTDQSLLSADIVMLDELFEGRAILKTLMRTIHERTFRKGTATLAVPAKLIMMASNEVPTERSMRTFYDRLIIRRVVSRVIDTGNRERLLDLELAEQTALVSVADIVAAQTESSTVELPSTVKQAVVSIWDRLSEVGIVASDRRLREAMRVVRAEAWLAGRQVADVSDLSVLEHILWITPDQCDVVADLVNSVVGANEVDTFLCLLEEIRAQVCVGLPDEERMALADELNAKMRLAGEDLFSMTDREVDGAALAMRSFGELRSLIATDLLEVPLEV